MNFVFANADDMTSDALAAQQSEEARPHILLLPRAGYKSFSFDLLATKFDRQDHLAFQVRFELTWHGPVSDCDLLVEADTQGDAIAELASALISLIGSGGSTAAESKDKKPNLPAKQYLQTDA